MPFAFAHDPSFKRFSRRAALAFAMFLAFASFGVGSAPMDAGRLDTPDGAVPEKDVLMAVFADAVYPDPLDPAPVPVAPVAALSGCLSVARFQLASLKPSLKSAATVVFACDNVPASARVLAWEDGRWRPVPFDRDSSARIRVKFEQLTTYAIVDGASDRPNRI